MLGCLSIQSGYFLLTTCHLVVVQQRHVSQEQWFPITNSLLLLYLARTLKNHVDPVPIVLYGIDLLAGRSIQSLHIIVEKEKKSEIKVETYYTLYY